MKKTTITLSFFFLVFFFTMTGYGYSIAKPNTSACEIYNLVVEKGDCTSDTTYTLTINFQYVNVGGDGFDLWANGQFFGYYFYNQLPLTIPNFPKSGNNNDWIEVCDNDNENCCRTKEFDTKECEQPNDCSISEVQIEKGECTSDSTYELTLNFQYVNVQSALFDLWVNGSYFDNYQYADLPITIVDFPKSGNSHDWIKICDNDNPFCCKIHEFLSKECGNNEECDIKELIVEAGECNEDGFFFVEIDFMVENPTGDAFKVLGNGMNHGEFQYSDLPITIGPLAGDCKKEWEFVVKDIENADCFEVFELGKKCCEESECQISELGIDVGDCNEDGTYKMWVNFQFTPGQSDSFKVYANGAYFGIYPYALPLFIPNFPKSGGNNDWIKVCDSEQNECCAIKEFESPECEGNNDCMIKELSVEYECDGEEIFYVHINFLPINPGSNGFKVKGNGIVYGEYNYADLPIVIGPLDANCSTEYEFLIQDKEFLDCEKVFELGKVCCQEEECKILELEVEVGECTTDSTYQIVINFGYQQPGNDYFDLWLNGEFHGYHLLANLPLTIPDFMPSGNSKDKVKVCINDAPDCCADIYFFPPNCLLYQPAYAYAYTGKDKQKQNEDVEVQGKSLRINPIGITINSHQYIFAPSGNWATIQDIQVVDLTGRILGSWQVENAQDLVIFTSPENTLTGIYFVQIKTDNRLETFKVFLGN
jgi:hypothetical protein